MWDWLLLIPLVALFTVFNAGLTLITARLTVHFRDLTQLLPFVSRFFFYTSGIFFSVERRFGDNETIMTDRRLPADPRVPGPRPQHPADRPRLRHQAGVLGLRRRRGRSPFLVVGTVYFWAAEERYGRTD